MKKMVTRITAVLALFLLAGCGGSSTQSTSSSSSNSSSNIYSKTKKDKAAGMDVDSLFENSKHTILLSGTTPHTVKAVRNEVLALRKSSYKSRLLSDTKIAEALASRAYKNSLSSSVKSESIYAKGSARRAAKSVAASKSQSESKSKELSASYSESESIATAKAQSKKSAATNSTAKTVVKHSSTTSSNSYMQNGDWTEAAAGMVFVSDSNKYYTSVKNPGNYQYISQSKADVAGDSPAARGNQFARP